jgi:selenocysteine-specific elongation factor
MNERGPLTLGTAGHIDHGKTALVQQLTGAHTDRLPEERERGITIVLGYAQLVLPSGRKLSVVDVPGHERFVRTMVAGATGVDLFLMVIAADDGVKPQTVEHAAVLRALNVSRGVVAVTKADVADPGPALEAAAELLPGHEAIACSSRLGTGLDELRAALDRVAARVTSRAATPGPPILHIDRAFSVQGRGVVVTGTLWSGAIHQGDSLALLPGGARVRVRGLQIHDVPVGHAAAGQRVAANLSGVRLRDVSRGDVLAAPDALAEVDVLDCALEMAGVRHGERVRIHHGTRDATGRAAHLEENLWQLRLERPLLAADGDRVVVRRLAPPDTVGGGVVLDAAARRHGRRRELLDRLRRRRDGSPEPEPEPERSAAPIPATAQASSVAPPAAFAEAESRLREAGIALISESQLTEDAVVLRALRETGSAVRVSGRLYAPHDVVDEVRDRVVEVIRAEGDITLARLRDALGTSRKSAQAWLEHFDGARVTVRLPDDRRVLSRRHSRSAAE